MYALYTAKMHRKKYECHYASDKICGPVVNNDVYLQPGIWTNDISYFLPGIKKRLKVTYSFEWVLP